MDEIRVWDDLGVRFEYPSEWELEVTDEGARTTVSLQPPGGAAFAIVVLDEDRPEPAELASGAVEAMREEYPDLEVVEARESIDGHRVVGHDLTFLSLDMAASCAIRCFQTPRRTIFLLGQWSDLDDDEFEAQLRTLRASLEETDS